MDENKITAIKLDYRKSGISMINIALKVIAKSNTSANSIEIDNIAPQVFCDMYGTSFDTDCNYDMDWDAEFTFDGTEFAVSGSARYGTAAITLRDSE